MKQTRTVQRVTKGALCPILALAPSESGVFVPSVCPDRHEYVARNFERKREIEREGERERERERER